ncbi:hypothetical protein PUN28_014329 [Cardiocondyla obscurior]|uniref:Uncharacterized protein n=1 Tax=Cardiocondyla obscurior TaxID=286306 RepID=A0AAW2EZL7_9HYME
MKQKVEINTTIALAARTLPIFASPVLRSVYRELLTGAPPSGTDADARDRSIATTGDDDDDDDEEEDDVELSQSVPSVLSEFETDVLNRYFKTQKDNSMKSAAKIRIPLRICKILFGKSYAKTKAMRKNSISNSVSGGRYFAYTGSTYLTRKGNKNRLPYSRKYADFFRVIKMNTHEYSSTEKLMYMGNEI